LDFRSDHDRRLQRVSCAIYIINKNSMRNASASILNSRSFDHRLFETMIIRGGN